MSSTHPESRGGAPSIKKNQESCAFATYSKKLLYTSYKTYPTN